MQGFKKFLSKIEEEKRNFQMINTFFPAFYFFNKLEA